MDRKRVVDWVAIRILPHEAAVRSWLRRLRVSPDEIDDLIQEAYCKFCDLDSVDHIPRPDRYFFQTVRNLLTDKLRRARIVRIETVAEIDSVGDYADELSPERITAARRDLATVRRLIGALPSRCRRVFELRKIEGLSQREIARVMNISESAVENDGVKGMRLILQALKNEEGKANKSRIQVGLEKKRTHERH